MNSFEIRTYGRTELALLYNPGLCPDSAYRKLKQWIDLCPGLRDGLAALGISSRSRTYTPAQAHLANLKVEVWRRKAEVEVCNGEVGTLGTDVHLALFPHTRARV